MLLVCIVLAAAAALCVHTQRGREALARAIERLVSAQIPGTVRIGRLERFGWFEPEFHDLRFIHPKGATVLQLESVRIDLDLGELLHARLGFREVQTRGGQIVLSNDPDGRLSLEAALDWPTPGTGDPKDGFHYRLRSMHVQDLTVVTRVAADQHLRLRNVRGFVGVERVNTPGVIVKLERIEGHFDRTLLGAEVAIERADGLITGKQKRVADMQLQLRIGKDQLAARARVFDREKTPVELLVASDGGVVSELTAFGLKLGTWFTDAVRVEWK